MNRKQELKQIGKDGVEVAKLLATHTKPHSVVKFVKEESTSKWSTMSHRDKEDFLSGVIGIPILALIVWALWIALFGG